MNTNPLNNLNKICLNFETVTAHNNIRLDAKNLVLLKDTLSKLSSVSEVEALFSCVMQLVDMNLVNPRDLAESLSFINAHEVLQDNSLSFYLQVKGKSLLINFIDNKNNLSFNLLGFPDFLTINSRFVEEFNSCVADLELDNAQDVNINMSLYYKSIKNLVAGIEVIKLAKNTYYQGELNKDEQPHGRGTLKNANNITVGQFAQGRAHGRCFISDGKTIWFDGMLREGVKHGLGVARLANGTRYIGYWQNNAFNGAGKLILPNGYSIECIWLAGKPQGKGKINMLGQSAYHGEFNYRLAAGSDAIAQAEDDLFFHGHGALQFHKSGNVYFGEWHNQKRQGFGVLCLTKQPVTGPNTDNLVPQEQEDGLTQPPSNQLNPVYFGDWQDNKCNGWGKFTRSDNSVYEGEFENDVIQGRGVLHFTDGRIFVGDWVAGKITGEGKMTCPDGSAYYGNWQDGILCGICVKIYADGTVYRGELENELPEGKGELFFASSDYCQGDFVAGRLNGSGSYYYESGAIYEGEFSDNRRHGYGIYTCENGAIYDGEWVHDLFQGWGTYIALNQMRHEGEWVNNLMHGQGTQNYPNKGEFKGYWQAGSLDVEKNEQLVLARNAAPIRDIFVRFIERYMDEKGDSVTLNYAAFPEQISTEVKSACDLVRKDYSPLAVTPGISEKMAKVVVDILSATVHAHADTRTDYQGANNQSVKDRGLLLSRLAHYFTQPALGKALEIQLATHFHSTFFPAPEIIQFSNY